MAGIVIDRIEKSFPGGVRAVDRVSLTVADGEFLVLVGPSGCGKTTLLRMIAGLEESTGGAMRLGGRDLVGLPPADRDLAMVFQNYALYPHMTVRRNLAFALEMRRVPKAEIERRVAEVAATLGLKELLERRPRELSGGQRQRVALGRAIVRQPQAFLFDEPLSNLDARLRVQMRAELKRLHRRLRTTAVYVTHDQEEAMTLGDRVVVMKDGTIQQVGRPLDVYERPANRFVAGFMGMPPMNLVDGRVEAARFEGGGLAIPLPGRPADGVATLGFRPEHLVPGPLAGLRLSLRVETLEPLGDRQDVHLLGPAGQSLVARIEARCALREGEDAVFSVDPAQLHLFDAQGLRTELQPSPELARA